MFTGSRSAATLLVAALIAGCGARPEHTVIEGTKGGDGALRVHLGGPALQSLNPNIGNDEMALLVGQNLFNKLVALAGDRTVIPDLAEEWERSADGLSYTFKLRRNVRWHDGRPFTSEDVRQTFARIPLESWNRDVAVRVASAEAIDPHTVVIRLKEPWAPFIPAIASHATSILPAHVYGDAPWQDHPANAAPVGTGPFRFKSWTPGRSIVLEKHVGFFGPGPFVDTLEYDLDQTHDPVARLLAGEIHLMIGRPAAARIPELSQAPDVRLVVTPADSRTYIAFNMRSPSFRDLRVRRAVNMALDRRALVEIGYSGFAAPAFGFYTPAVAWAYNAAARVPAYDRAEAKRLLAALPRAQRRWTLLHPPASAPLARAVAAQLATVGAAVHPVQVAAEAYIASARSGKFDMAFLFGVQGPDPDNLATRFSSAGAMQLMGYSNPSLDAVLARGGVSDDVLARTRAYLRAQEILAADLPIAPIAESVRISAFRATVRGHYQDDAVGLVPDYTFNLIRLRRDRE